MLGEESISPRYVPLHKGRKIDFVSEVSRNHKLSSRWFEGSDFFIRGEVRKPDVGFVCLFLNRGNNKLDVAGGGVGGGQKTKRRGVPTLV